MNSCTCKENPSAMCAYCVDRAGKKKPYMEPDERIIAERRELMKELGYGRVFPR